VVNGETHLTLEAPEVHTSGGIASLVISIDLGWKQISLTVKLCTCPHKRGKIPIYQISVPLEEEEKPVDQEERGVKEEEVPEEEQMAAEDETVSSFLNLENDLFNGMPTDPAVSDDVRLDGFLFGYEQDLPEELEYQVVSFQYGEGLEFDDVPF